MPIILAIVVVFFIVCLFTGVLRRNKFYDLAVVVWVAFAAWGMYMSYLLSQYHS
jgi:hypothetical protein